MADTLNGVDLSVYGAEILNGTYNSLLKPAETKEWVSNDNPAKSGTDYIQPATPKLKERSVSIIFGIRGFSTTDFNDRYDGFISVLQAGICKFWIEEHKRYYYLKYETCTDFHHYSLKACKIAIKFTEPDPTKRT